MIRKKKGKPLMLLLRISPAQAEINDGIFVLNEIFMRGTLIILFVLGG